MKKIVVNLVFIYFICIINHVRCQLPFNSEDFMRLTQIIVTDNGSTDLEVDDEGNLYLLNTKKNKVFKYLAVLKYDSVYSIGGKSSRDEGFFHPAKISARNRQTVYLLDDVKREIVLLNTNLKVLGRLRFIENENELLEDIFPVSFDVSDWGEMFVLNFTDNKIYKYNEKGYSGISFGGLDYGQGQLISPVSMGINAQNFVFVGDSANQIVKVFDIYGTFQYSISTQKKLSYRWKRFSLYNENIVFFDEKNITLYHLLSDEILSLPLHSAMNPLDIQDVCMRNHQIFVLNGKQVFVFSI